MNTAFRCGISELQASTNQLAYSSVMNEKEGWQVKRSMIFLLIFSTAVFLDFSQMLNAKFVTGFNATLTHQNQLSVVICEWPGTLFRFDCIDTHNMAHNSCQLWLLSWRKCLVRRICLTGKLSQHLLTPAYSKQLGKKMIYIKLYYRCGCTSW